MPINTRIAVMEKTKNKPKKGITKVSQTGSRRRAAALAPASRRYF
jgi:hypothetical protein